MYTVYLNGIIKCNVRDFHVNKVLNWPIGDHWVIPRVRVGGGQLQHHRPFFCVFQQEAADVAAEAELRLVVIHIQEADCDGGDVLVRTFGRKRKLFIG